MSIIRVGLSDKNFATGYDAIFSKKPKKAGPAKDGAAKEKTARPKKNAAKKK